LHIASESKWGGCALLLINIGKADVTIRDEDGYTPLHVAMKQGAKEIVSYIANTGILKYCTSEISEILLRTRAH
jgi:ankyrin repeat protein